MKKIIISLLSCIILLTGFLGGANAADFTVNQVFDGADATPGDGTCATLGGNCTLRAAVMETNALMGVDTITIPAGTYTLALGNTGEDVAAEGDLDILDDLTITGVSPAATTINGNAFKYRVFSILKRADGSMPVVAISNLTLTQGVSDNNGALIYNAGELTIDNVTLTDASPDSRAMVNVGNFTMNNSQVTGNTSGVYSETGFASISDSVFSNNVSTVTSGAALYLASGTGVISNTIFSNNTSQIGGAIYNSKGLFNLNNASLDINNSQFNGNQAIYPSYPYRAKGGAVFSSGSVNISNSSFESNQSEDGGGALYLEGSSSKIFNSTFSNNIAENGGGGIYADLVNDSLRIKKVTMIGNQATNNGGGIFVSFAQAIDRFWLSESILNNNTAGNVGGGIALATAYKYRDFNSTLRHVEISNNTASYGGGLFTEINGVTIQNTTIANNFASVDGGGLYQNTNIDKAVELIHLTIANNSSTVGAGSNVFNEGGIIRINNTLIANPASGQNCAGNITTLGYNLSSDASCGLGVEGDQSNIAPLLGALADNGGFNKTMALQAGSPAIDAGSTLLCASLNPLDQRYYYRGDAACDIGAYESGSARAQSGTMAFTTLDTTVNETDGMVIVTFSRTNGSEGNVGIPVYDVGSGTASVGSPYYDYDAIPLAWIEWADGDSSDKTLSITIYDDSNIEGDKTINLQFDTPVFSYGGASLGTSLTTVTIVDDETAPATAPGVIAFEEILYQVSENNSTVTYTLLRTGGTDGVVSVDVTFEDGSALFGTDYNANSRSFIVTFQDGESSISGAVSIIDDSNVEVEEFFTIRLSNPQGGATLGFVDSSAVAIADNNGGAVVTDPGSSTSSDSGGGGAIHPALLFGLLLLTPTIRRRKQH